MTDPRPFAAKATLRLTALMALAVTLLSLAAMALQYRLVETRLMQAQQTLLTADLDGLAALYDQRRIIALRQAIDYRATAATGDEMLLLMDRNGTVLAGTRKDWSATLAPSGDTFTPDNATIFTEGQTRWLAVARTLPGGFPLLVARSLAPVDATLASLRRGMLALLAALLVAGSAVGWLAARTVMQRITRLNTLADRVAEGALDARLPGPRTPDEFGLLETHVHAMLDRIENLNRATHRLSDTIAHELRTPLNRMLQKLGKIEGQPDLTADLKAEMRQAIRMFDSLLDISRAEADAGTGGGLVPVDLSAVAAEVWDLYDPLLEDKGLQAEAHITPDLKILGDRNLIAQVLSNLLDNAIKYCAAGDRLTLALTPDEDRLLMRLSDTGPGLPEDLKPEAFDRFTRAERDRATPGHGLGLALVRAIAARHGARLTLPPTDKGFALEIRWPRLQQSDWPPGAPMRRALFPLLLLLGCAPWNQPQNVALQGENAPLTDPASGDGELYIGLAFSGGGMRATAFAYGMLQELQAADTGTPNGLLDNVRLVSGVSGGSVMAAQLGLKGPQGLQGFRETFLITDAEAYMTTSGLNPLTIAKGVAGGVNGRDTFGRYLDDTIFHGATFADLRTSRIKTWINATDMANNTPFLFSPETFDALCSDLSKVKLSEAVAASAAFPLVFTPIVLEAHHKKCTYREPDWLTAARYNPEATAAMRAHARALESYTNPDEVKFVKLLDGGINDNFGTTGLAVERARAQVPYAPLTAEEAVKLKRMLFLVANAGVDKDYDWTQKVAGPGGVNLAMSIATSAMSAASRSGYDSMRGELRLWETELIEWRCALPLSEVRKLRGTTEGWDCKDVKLFVGEVSSAALPTDLRDQLDAVPTRLKLPEAQIDLVIAAARQATRAAPEFNGFLASLTENPIDSRIQDGIASGGRRVTPLN